MKVTTLIENTVLDSARGCVAEHGIALHIEARGMTILADVGGSDRFIRNARQLGVDIGAVDMVVISHAHSDHGGGLSHFFDANRRAPVYIHRKGLGEYYFRAVIPRISVGLDLDLLKQQADRIHWVETFNEIADGVFILTDIAQPYPLPRGNKRLLKKEGSKLIPDTFAHEILLVIQEDDGLVLYTGCSHRGILNMFDAAATRFADTPIKAVFGGFHMFNPLTKRMAEKKEDVERIGREMLRYPVDRVYTGHCTGLQAYNILDGVMGDRLGYFATGSEFVV